ncbi:hypothetical protein [Nitrospira sp. Kam-Ns4a]
MKIEQERKKHRPRCPCCDRGVLHPTGAFSICDLCGLAITRQALAYANTVSQDKPSQDREQAEPPRVATDEDDTAA